MESGKSASQHPLRFPANAEQMAFTGKCPPPVHSRYQCAWRGFQKGHIHPTPLFMCMSKSVIFSLTPPHIRIHAFTLLRFRLFHQNTLPSLDEAFRMHLDEVDAGGAV